MQENRVSVLYVDDEPHNLLAFKANLRQYYDIYTAESAEEGKEILKNKKIHIIISDQRMPTTTGVEFLESIIIEYPDAIRMLITGYTDINTVIESINKGQVFRYIVKPFNVDELKMAIDNAFEIYSLRAENKQLMRSLLRANKQLEFMLRQRLISLDDNTENI